MPPETLNDIVEYAQNKHYPLYFLYGKDKPDKKYEKIIQKATHTKIVPADVEAMHEKCIIIIDHDNKELINTLSDSPVRNIILRLERNEISQLHGIFTSLTGKYKRLNLHLLDIHDYTDEDIEAYKNQLSRISSLVAQEYIKGNAIELNIFTDRILLGSMNNCNAGLDHVSFAPNGLFYLCPGFYFDDESDSIGDIKHGICIKDEAMLTLKNAPICSICDAYHCKRCVYLNRKTTLEINTPSYQQCVLSHHERNEARLLSDTLRRTPGFHDFDKYPVIPEIGYLDPYKVIIGEATKEIKGMNLQTGKPGGNISFQAIQTNANNSKPGHIIIKDGEKTIKLPYLKKVEPAKNTSESPGNKIAGQKQAAMGIDPKSSSPPLKKAMQMVKDMNEKELENISSKDLLVEIYKMLRIILKEFNK